MLIVWEFCNNFDTSLSFTLGLPIRSKFSISHRELRFFGDLDFDFGILSDILCDTFPDILSESLPDSLSDILPDILPDILSDILPDIRSVELLLLLSLNLCSLSSKNEYWSYINFKICQYESLTEHTTVSLWSNC